MGHAEKFSIYPIIHLGRSRVRESVGRNTTHSHNAGYRSFDFNKYVYIVGHKQDMCMCV